ncbi:L,D-transpeptidase family protein [Streptomyces sp. HO565]|uniref:L,D-transpeptidase n=1 Tax=Streptomyces sp. HO565 TaxID=2857489 RepID=UPI0038B46249
MRHVHGRARRAGAALAAVMTWAVLPDGAAGCTSGGSGIGPGNGELFGKPPAPEDVIRVTPDDASKGVRPEGELSVRVPGGRLESVKVVKSQDAQETPVPGRISADGLSWKPGTKVTVALKLRDVEGAPGVYGLQRRTFSFTVGRSQVSLVDAVERTMEVRRDGTLPATVPITAGAPSTPTYNGKMVVTEMLDVTRMNSRTVGFGGEYDIPDVPHAVRLTSSGTFLHGNYWAPADTFGRANVSHGCVGLRDVKGGGSDTPAGWFFDRSLIGDVVEVVRSKSKEVDPDNGLGGWNMSWTAWKAGSEVR